MILLNELLYVCDGRLEFFNFRFWLPLLLHLFNTFLHLILATNETLDVFFLDGETLFLASSILMNDFVFNNKFGLVFELAEPTNPQRRCIDLAIDLLVV